MVLDSLLNSDGEALSRVAALAGLPGWQQHSPRHWSSGEDHPHLTLLRGDVRSPEDLRGAFNCGPALQRAFSAVLHFAGLKSVGESVAHPLRYWDVNVGGSRALLEAMERAGCRTIVFSSSATLYGVPEAVPIPETAPLRPINPYGTSKGAVERMLADVAGSHPAWRIARLRYFNPIGAHPSGRIGEAPQGIPTNLFPLISQVAVGRRDQVMVFGSDWPTHDGTGVRDYIHVMDLAEGHRCALDLLLRESPQLLTLNLGTGRGCSVLELVRAFETASGRPIPLHHCPRRPGDMAISVADPSEAERRMGWKALRSIDAMCRDGWHWQSANPRGYQA